ncbi:hypothetical protein HPB47_009385 [Ixodes persulcatus]|uniref:Uncharacterized protein n=1 Tax=Ixodes persulcatus TaxID=34615 RepID=A0AC60P279_IXOPE|nr:hypothetical protein HPB47_009385 [Ixodes persulcatus]
MASGTPSLTASQKTRTERYSMPPSACGSSIAELENEASVTNLAEVRAPDLGPHITPPNAEMLTSDMEIADTDQGEWYDAKTSKKRKKNSSSSKSGDTVTNSPTTTVGLTVVFVPAVENQKITAISSLKLSVALEQMCPECIHEIRPNSRLNLIAVDTQNGQTTRALLACTHICGLRVGAYEPVPRHFAVGVIKDVDTSPSDAEIEQHVRSPEGRVARIRRLGQSSIVKIAFSETTLPSFVYLGHDRHPVTPFKERPIQCRKCCGYGHSEANCKRPPICSRCGEAHDGNDTCSVKLTLPRPLPAQNGRDKVRPAATHANTQLTFAPQGYLHKQPVFRQHLRTSSRPPDVLILQETHDTPITLPGYQPFIAANAPHGVSTLVRNRTTAIEHDLHDRRTEHLFIELIPHKKRTDGIFILNIYNTPSLRHSRFLTLFKKALNAAGGSPLVIGGDFNLPHTGWGYKHCSAAGRNLWQDSHDLGFTLIPNPTFPTRLVTSAARDTTPDLTFTKNVVNSQWRNTQYDLGSDHSIIKITLPHLTTLSTRTKEFAFVDWDAFRKHRTEKAADSSITDIESWSRDLQSDTQLATRTIKTDAPTERMDSRLAYLIEAKTSILSRWKGQRLNKRLRKKQDRLTKLLFTETKAHGDHVTKTLCQKYIPSGSARPHRPYTGSSNSALDEDFCVAEVHAALRKLNSRSAPGSDCVTNKTLRNLDDSSVEQLTEYINDCWRQGSIPPS